MEDNKFHIKLFKQTVFQIYMLAALHNYDQIQFTNKDNVFIILLQKQEIVEMFLMKCIQ